MRVLPALALLGLLLACGANAGSEPATSLRVSVWLEGRGEGQARAWTLRCGPVGGTLPRAAAACSRLSGMARPFRPVPKDAICSLQYGGPTEALVTGRYRGRAIWTRFHRRDGCHIARWRGHEFLFPVRPASP